MTTRRFNPEALAALPTAVRARFAAVDPTTAAQTESAYWVSPKGEIFDMGENFAHKRIGQAMNAVGLDGTDYYGLVRYHWTRIEYLSSDCSIQWDVIAGNSQAIALTAFIRALPKYRDNFNLQTNVGTVTVAECAAMIRDDTLTTERFSEQVAGWIRAFEHVTSIPVMTPQQSLNAQIVTTVQTGNRNIRIRAMAHVYGNCGIPRCKVCVM